MPGLAELAALVVAAGCALAAGAPDRRTAVLGVTLALVAAPLIAPRLPDLLSLAFRETAALIGAYLLWVVTRGGGRAAWRGVPTFAAVFVVLAFVGALGLSLMLGPERGPAAALAAAASAAMAALSLSIGSGAVLAAGLGSVLLVLAAALAVTGLAGIGAPLDHAVTGAALLAVTTAAAFLATGASPRPDAPPAV